MVLCLKDLSGLRRGYINALQANIEYRYYESGHMVYANEASLHALHDNVADFIRRGSVVAPAAAKGR